VKGVVSWRGFGWLTYRTACTRICREEIIAEHPEILGELEEERDRMMAEKERLEQELAEAQKIANTTLEEEVLAEAEIRADGRQPHPETQHAAFVTHTTSEEVLDLDDEEFDVVGHQEPLSDTRVHEDTTTTTSDSKDSGSSISQQQGEENPIGLRATFREFRERIVRDFNAIADVVFPKSMRGPTKEALQKAARIAKREAINVYKFVMRYVKAFIEKRKNETGEETTGKSVCSGGGIEEESS